MSDDSYSLGEEKSLEAGSKEFLKLKFWPAWGISAGLILFFELIFRFALKPEINPAHAYIGYMTGILVLGVFSYMVRSKLKGFVGSLGLILFSFIPYLVLSNVFYGLFSVLQSTVRAINKALNAVSLIDPNFTNPLVNTPAEVLLKYSFVFDLLFALFICLPAAGILSWLMKTLSKKPDVKTLIGIPFLIVFLLIFVILLPFLLVGVSGASQFGVNMGIGGIYLQKAVGVFSDSNSSGFQAAFPYLDNATGYFEIAEENFKGLNSMGIFWITGLALPAYKPLIDNGVVLVESAVKLAQAIAPFAKGVFTMGDALKTAFTALGVSNSSSSLLSLAQSNTTSPVNDQLFNKSLALLGAASANLTIALKKVKDALNSMKNLDYAEMAKVMEQNFGDNSTIVLVKDGTDAFDQIISVLQVFLDPSKTGPNTNENALQLILRGFRDLKLASNLLGGSSMFNGTETLFTNLKSHLGPVVQYTLNDTVINSFLSSPGVSSPEIDSVLNTTKSAIRFFKDASVVTLNFGDFGLLAAPIYEIGTRFTSQFQGNLTTYGNFSNIPLANYDNDWIPNLTVMYLNASDLNVTATKLQASLDNMRSSSNAGEYGFFNDQSQALVDLMGGINYTEEASNIKAISGKLLSIITAIRWLKIVTAKYVEFSVLANNANYSNSTEVSQLLASANELDHAVNMSRWALGNAANNDTQGLSQMSNIDTAVNDTITAMDTKIIPAINTIKSELNNVDSNSSTVVSDALDQIVDGLTDISNAMSGIQL